MVRMIKNLNNLLKELNLNNVLNVIIGFKGLLDVVQWGVDVDMNFVMIVEEVIVPMEHAKIKGKKDDYEVNYVFKYSRISIWG